MKALNQSLAPMFESVSEAWQARAPRERWLITLASVFVLGALLYAFVLEPSLTGIKRLNASLPSLQAQASKIQQLSQQVQANPKNNAARRNQASLQADLAKAVISAKVSAAAPWLVTIESASGEALYQWLKSNPASKAQLKQLGTGNWQGDITLDN